MKHLLLSLAILFSLTAFSQETFFQNYHSPNSDEGLNIIQNGNDGYFIGGFSHDIAKGEQCVLKKIDCTGNEIWTKNIESNASNNIGNRCILNNNNEIIFLTSTTIQDTATIVLVCIDQSGNELWTTNVAKGTANSLALTEDGNMLITGGSTSITNTLVIKTDSQGIPIWKRDYYPTTKPYNISKGIDILEYNNDIYVCGDNLQQPYWTEKAPYLLKLASNGDSLWSISFNDYIFFDFISMKSTSDNNLIFQGSYYNAKASKKDAKGGILVKTNLDGEKLWDYSFNYDQYTYGSDVAESDDGGFVSSCAVEDINGNTQMLLQKVNAQGEFLWSKSFEFADYTYGNDLIIDENGFVICTGTLTIYDSGEGKNSFLIKTNADGELNNINEIGNSIGLRTNITPNPAYGTCNLQILNPNIGEVNIKIITNTGKVVSTYNEQINDQSVFEIKLPINNLTSGIYFLKITNADRIVTDKIIVK